MFWRFVNPTGSNFEALLSREPPPTLDELLDDADVLTECKTQNARLMELLGRDDMVRGLLGWVTKGLEQRPVGAADDDGERQRRQRFRQLAAEVLCSEAWAIAETALGRPDAFLAPFWDAVLGPDPAAAAAAAAAAVAAGAEEKEVGGGDDQPPAAQSADAADADAPSAGAGGTDGSSDGPASSDVDLDEHDEAAEEKPMELEDEVDLPAAAAAPARARATAAGQAADEGWHPAVAVGDGTTVAHDSDDDEFEEVADDDEPPSAASAAAAVAADEPTELDRVDNECEVIYGQWSRVNAHLLGKKTAEMLGFIRSQPAIVERLLANITSPAVVDLLIRIIQCEDSADGQGVLGWLSAEQLIPRLTDLLGPAHPPATHDAAAELLKGIIIMSAPAPAPFASPAAGQGAGAGGAGAGGGGGADGTGAVGGSRNNRFARELVSDEHVRKLVGFMLDPPPPSAPSPSSPAPADADASTAPEAAPDDEQADVQAAHASSLVSVVAIFIELIRKNNSDYSEPHLFHTLRNGLMSHSTAQASKALLEGAIADDGMDDDAKEAEDRVRLEQTMEELNASLGIVHLGHLLAVLSDRVGDLQRLLAAPRTAPSTPDARPALTLERFRIIELYAELLHCSNMAVLNRPAGTGPRYDPTGQLMGGLDGLDVLNGALNGTDDDEDDDDDEAPSPGDVLKQKIMDHGLLSSLLDLFLEFPLNNFLHSSVYDVVQQILSSRLEQGLNQALILHLFKQCGLVGRLLEGQRRSDASPIRLGYMGHLVLIAEDTLKFLAECPDDLKAFLLPSFDGAAWQQFVDGPYAAAKAKDNAAMGGGKPALSLLAGAGGSALDDAESDSDEEISEQMDTTGGGGSAAAAGTNSNGNGNASEMFSRYMAQQIGASSTDRHFESASSDDDDDDDSEWMADRHSFQPAAGAVPSSTSRLDPFGASSAFDDDDAWGVFQSTPSGGAMASSDDPFGDDFASGPRAGGGGGGPNSEALAALEWNDATFQAEFRDFDSEDDDGGSGGAGAPGANVAGVQIHIPDARADSDEEMSFTPTAASAQWNVFNARAGAAADDDDDDDIAGGGGVSSHASTSPQGIPPSFGSANGGGGGPAGHPVSPSTAAPLGSLTLSTSPVSTFRLPSAAASIFTPMSAISPPDPSLLETVSEHAPLGPGVGRDVKAVTQLSAAGVPESMLEKTSSEDGSRIVVPKDEIVLAVEAEQAQSARQAATP